MALKDIVKRDAEKQKEAMPQPIEEESDFLEISADATEETGKIGVKIETLNGYADTDRVQEMLRGGTIIFLKIRDLRAKDSAELKRSVEKLKKTLKANDGDIVGIDEDFLVITPRFATVYRG
ncbi:cell division protein SepF [archaeon]|nr:MAG: cell division protein SepF [archaeon]